ncbi:alpha/beta fold hydrolase [Curtobacterium poinsettiae]|uniref:Alpha/beta fold hydrolase n=1 Tax=Curtobacterium poinsettiae TaxID=159612 RepID=A0ABT3S7F6_9MICO|nr:alpha/beta fold hydrolase [Curtobacterium flaccumfaciens]MBT1610698.1 alpha/beta hydrolase [Curtobacterium flaccumfaciens pv. poinsettiae]MCX2850189.1 alpha/beta fold hydrolase [Curtobacterium flaccumfaciens pv. poinsettiae]UXN18378.1 alpha/beta hydrolase [Curtobacterium flaccumfaciens pv. poinsettiae]
MRAAVETVRIDGLPVRLHTMPSRGQVRDEADPTVVFVHGIGMSHRSFARSQRAVAAAHHTISVDLPGFGWLPAAGRRLSIEELGDVAVRAVRHLVVDDLVLVGQSMGTQVVIESARRHPDAVTAIVLVGPVIDAERRSLPMQALDLGRDGFVEGVRMNTVLVTDYLRSMRQYLRELGPMLRYPTEQTITEVTQPVLVVRGTQDPIARHDWSARLAAAAPDGTFVELAGPHHVQERQPDALARLLETFRSAERLEGLR